MDKFKVMFLGYSGSGKTYLQGSFFKLASATGSKGISLQALRFNEETSIQKAYEIISGQKDGQIPTTIMAAAKDLKIHTNEMVLKKGINELFQIDITDIEGQALDPGRNVEVSEVILSHIHTYDCLILVIEYPTDEVALLKAQQELGQLLNFAGRALAQNPKIPLTLVINKIDKVGNSTQIKSKSDQEISTVKQELMKQYPNNSAKRRNELKKRQGAILNKQVKPLVENDLIWELCDQYFVLLRESATTIFGKVFFASSVGFGSKNDNNIENYLNTSIYKPYGGVAAFLWTIYARLAMQTTIGANSNLEINMPITQLIEDLRSDLQELHLTGQAYFDPDNDDSENIWALRNSVAFRAGIDN